MDRGRVAPADELAGELEAAGFASIEVTHVRRHDEIPRAHALEMIRGRFASSFAHIPDDEYEAGLARAEREMPDTVLSDLRLVDLRCDTR